MAWSRHFQNSKESELNKKKTILWGANYKYFSLMTHLKILTEGYPNWSLIKKRVVWFSELPSYISAFLFKTFLHKFHKLLEYLLVNYQIYSHEKCLQLCLLFSRIHKERYISWLSLHWPYVLENWLDLVNTITRILCS